MKMIENHSERSESPAELRAMFGRNLRLLCQPYASVSALCRELGINRTQFNRYLSGESFPRPDILQRICAYFKVDARILLQPLHEVQNSNTDVIFSNEMERFSHRSLKPCQHKQLSQRLLPLLAAQFCG